MPAEATNNPGRILLVLIGRLGDYIATTPFLAGLRAKYPAARITLITSAKARNLASTNRDIDRLIIFKGWHDIPGTLRVFAAAMRKYDLAIDLNPAYSRTSLRLIRLRKAAARMTFRKKAPEGAYTCVIDHDLANEHMLDKYVNLAARLGFRPPENMRVTLSEKALLEGKKLFGALGLPAGNFVVAVHPGNFKKTENRWPEDKFVEFTREILKRDGTSVFYIAGPGEEKRIAETILPFLPGVKLVPPAPEEVTAAVLKNASVLVCNNTGTLHLAAAAGVPTFSFNRPYTAKCWKPRGAGNFFITSTDEASCRDIGVNEALEAFYLAAEKLKAGR